MRSSATLRCALWSAVLMLTILHAEGASDSVSTIENADLQVRISPAEGNLEVLDKLAGSSWRQAPDRAHSEFTHVERAGKTRLSLRTTFRDDDGNPLAARVDLRLLGRNLEMSVELDPTGRPSGGFDFIKPFVPSVDSYLVAADYTDGHMYPCKLDAWPLYNLDRINVSALDMPWIGIFDIKSGHGYSVIVDTPFDAKFKCQKFGGYRAPLVYWENTKGVFGYKRKLTYHFTAKGGYVDEAMAFRSKTILGKLDDKAKRNPNIKKLYGAPELWDFFHNVSDQELRTLGVVKCLHHVQTWTKYGDAVKLANSFGYLTEDYDYYLAGHPVSSSHPFLSGSSGTGYYLTPNYQAVGQSGKFIEDGDFRRVCPLEYKAIAKQTIPQRLANFPTSGIYFDQITADYLGVADGGYGGGSTEECWSREHPAGKTQWHDGVLDFLKYVVEELGQIPAAEHGKWWEVPYTSVFYGIPSVQWPWPDVSYPKQYGDDAAWQLYEKWGSVGHAYRVPLWELVYHDSAIAMWYPWDTNDVTVEIPNDWMQEDKDANSVLYGIPASYIVDRVGTGSWFKNRNKFMTSYRNACKIHEEIADKQMLTHEFLTEDRDVQQTTWSDGTRIVANFGQQDWTVGDKVLKRFGWGAKGPWGESVKAWDQKKGRVVTTIRKNGYYFDDAQTSQGAPIAEAYSLVDKNTIRVNVDQISATVVDIVPGRVKPGWNLQSTRVYQCDPKTGARAKELAWTTSSKGVLSVGPLSGWIVLDVARG